jgi:pimeloyl-ACP methyl ester carboxylesterase
MQSADGPRARLDIREQTCLIDSGPAGLRLFLRELRSTASSRRGAVLYLYGATFPSALSVAYRFGSVSWRDALCRAGFDVWALDFLGFGGSDRYAEMEANADAHARSGGGRGAVHSRSGRPSPGVARYPQLGIDAGWGYSPPSA